MWVTVGELCTRTCDLGNGQTRNMRQTSCWASEREGIVRTHLACTFAVALIALCTVSQASADTIVDLTSENSFGTTNGAYFTWTPENPTGTGVIDPFLRIQGKGITSGYNTDESPMQLEQKAGAWTHSIKLADIPIVNGYYQFLLDINQEASEPLLTMHELVLYQGFNPNVSDFDLTTQTFNDDPLAFKAFDLDSGPNGDSRVEMDFRLNPGSGWGDVVAYIPVARFTGAGPYLYLYSAFGDPNADNDGFEEWATLEGLIDENGPPPPVVPLPTAAWAGLALAGVLGVSKLYPARRNATLA